MLLITNFVRWEYAGSCIGVCIVKHLPLADVSCNGTSGCRSWNLFSCLFLHFMQAVSSMWAILLKVHVALEIVCLRQYSQAGLDSLRACFPWLFQITISCFLFLLCWGWGGASKQTSVGFKSMLFAENLARTHAQGSYINQHMYPF